MVWLTPRISPRGSPYARRFANQWSGERLVVEGGHLVVAGASGRARPPRASVAWSRAARCARRRGRRAPRARRAAGGRGRARARTSASHMRLMSVVAPPVVLERAAPDRLGAQVGDDHLARAAGAARPARRSSRPAGRTARPSGARARRSTTRRHRRASGCSGSTARSRPSRRSAAARRRASRRRAARAAPASAASSSDAASASLRRSSSASSASPAGRQPRDRARAGPARPASTRHHPVGLERAQQPAEVARVEPEPRAQRAHLAAAAPISHSTRASPSGRSSARKWSSSAPTRCVTVRLKRRTCSTSPSAIT